jgi:hypothetical protein
MRALKSRLGVFFSILAAAGVMACTQDLPTDPAIPDATASARQPGVAYTTALVPLLAGDNTSRANGVNNAGEIVGYSCCSPQSRAFVTLGGVATALSSNSSFALAISNGATRYVVGWAGSPSLPVRWSISGSTPDQPSYLNLGTATWGAAIGVNDAGEAVGHVGVSAAMWDAAGNLSVVPTPAGYTRGEGRDINNSGEAVFVFTGSDLEHPYGFAVGYLRLSDGTMIVMPPLTVDGTTYANAVNDAHNGQVDVAGSSLSDPSSARGAQWTIDVATQQVIATRSLADKSHSVALTDAGVAAGFLEGPTSSLRTDAFRWVGSDFLKLNPPKGAKHAIAWAISPDGHFIVGETMMQFARRAVLWTMP